MGGEGGVAEKRDRGRRKKETRKVKVEESRRRRECRMSHDRRVGGGEVQVDKQGGGCQGLRE